MQISQKNLAPTRPSIDGFENIFDFDLDPIENLLTDSQIPTNEVTADTRDLWTLTEAATALNVSTRTILRKLKKGELNGYKVSGANGPEWRIFAVANESATVNPVKTYVTPVSQEESIEPDQGNNSGFESLLKILESQAEQLKAASQVMVYQIEKLEEKDRQIKSLQYRKPKMTWWDYLKKFLFG